MPKTTASGDGGGGGDRGYLTIGEVKDVAFLEIRHDGYLIAVMYHELLARYTAVLKLLQERQP